MLRFASDVECRARTFTVLTCSIPDMKGEGEWRKKIDSTGVEDLIILKSKRESMVSLVAPNIFKF